ncbi:hypothetical protein AA313_de0204718 [Arthrobotrys entomopaga]|nr:hypothetical protein AA313_de0204718 [Arthrobotrys entomopaga]
MDTFVQPFNTGRPNSPGAPPTEFPSISLDTEMMDEDEMMAMGEATLETPIDDQQQQANSSVPSDIMTPNKVHLRGLDNMSSTDVKAFVAAHFSGAEIDKLEWIDDTSLNLVYKDDATALAALTALSTEFGARSQPWELREAKRSEAYPLVRLDVRLAFVTDKKEVGSIRYLVLWGVLEVRANYGLLWTCREELENEVDTIYSIPRKTELNSKRGKEGSTKRSEESEEVNTDNGIMMNGSTDPDHANGTETAE